MVNIGNFKKSQENDMEISRQLGNQYIQIFKMHEKINELEGKLGENQRLLSELQRKYIKMGEKGIKTVPYRAKTKAAIRLILKKHVTMTSDQLCKVIGLSRTRCNEYLKELENSGLAESKLVDRKKHYSLKK